MSVRKTELTEESSPAGSLARKSIVLREAEKKNIKTLRAFRTSGTAGGAGMREGGTRLLSNRQWFPHHWNPLVSSRKSFPVWLSCKGLVSFICRLHHELMWGSVVVGVTPLRCSLQLEPSKEGYTTRLVGLESHWKASETPPLTNSSGRYSGSGTAHPSERERRKKEIIQLQSPSAQKRWRRRKREGGKSLSAAPWAEMDHPAGPVRQAAASLGTSGSGMGGGERGSIWELVCVGVTRISWVEFYHMATFFF